MKEININTEYIKLDQLLKFANAVEGGGMAKNVILDGLVKVNEEVVLQRGKKLREGDMIEFNNEKYLIKASRCHSETQMKNLYNEEE